MMRIAVLIVLTGLLLPVADARPAAVIAPGDNLVVEGVPPIAASLAEKIGRYTEIREADFLDWHPVRREMLIATRFGATYQIHLVKSPGGARTQLTFYREPVRWGSFQPTVGSYFLFSRDVGGDENYQLYRFDLASGDVTLLTDGASRNLPGVWSRAGDRFAYTSTRRNGQDVDLWVINPTQPESDRLVVELAGGGWSPLDWSPDDRQLLVAEYISINESHLWLIDAETGERSAVTPRGDGPPVAYGEARFARDGLSLYATTDRESEFLRLARLDLATGRHDYLTSHLAWDVERFELSWDDATIAFVTNEDGASALHLLDTRRLRERPAPQLAPCVVSGLRWHRDNRHLALAWESARAPGDVHVLDTRKGVLAQWTHSETGGVSVEAFPEPELVRWRSFDGLTISGFLHRPPPEFTGRRPLLISIHGGPEGQARPNFQARLNYLINELGIAVIHPNVRGSTGYGKTFAQLDNGLRREDSYRDIGALLDWAAQQPELDSDRILVMGGSYGGHMTLAVAVNYPERIRCAVDYVGISHLATFLENTAEYRRDLRRVEYGDERDPEMRAFMERTAPLNNAHKITKPMFIVQGGNDPRVPLSEAEQMLATLKRIGTPVWYLMAKDEGHGFAKKHNADFLLYALVAFAQEFLLGS